MFQNLIGTENRPLSIKPNNSSILNPTSSFPKYAFKFKIIRSISKKGWE